MTWALSWFIAWLLTLAVAILSHIGCEQRHLAIEDELSSELAACVTDRDLYESAATRCAEHLVQLTHDCGRQ